MIALLLWLALSVVPASRTITLAWDASVFTDNPDTVENESLVRYKVYGGLVGQDLQLIADVETTTADIVLPDTGDYRFGVTSYLAMVSQPTESLMSLKVCSATSETCLDGPRSVVVR